MRGFQLYRPQPSGSFGPITAAYTFGLSGCGRCDGVSVRIVIGLKTENPGVLGGELRDFSVDVSVIRISRSADLPGGVLHAATAARLPGHT